MNLRRKKKYSFSLVEVLISLSILFIATIPLLNDVIMRVKIYRDMQEKTEALIQAEESFFAELGWIGTSESCTFQLLQEGYKREEKKGGGGHIQIITRFDLLAKPKNQQQELLKAYLGELSVSILIEKKGQKEPIDYMKKSFTLLFSGEES